MPPPTQAQQSFGTGPVNRGANYMTEALTPSGGVGGPGVQPVPISPMAPQQKLTPPGVDPAWSRMFGSATPTSLLSAREANGGVLPSLTATTQPNQPTAGQGVPKAPTTPALASQTNALMPGANATANPDNGFSREKQNGGQSNNERGGPAPDYMAQALTPPTPQPAPPPPPPPPGPRTPMGGGWRGPGGEVGEGTRVPFDPPPPPVPMADVVSEDPLAATAGEGAGGPSGGEFRDSAAGQGNANGKAVQSFQQFWRNQTGSNLNLKDLPPFGTALNFDVPPGTIDYASLTKPGGPLDGQFAVAGLIGAVGKLEQKISELQKGGAGAGQVLEKQRILDRALQFLENAYGVTFGKSQPSQPPVDNNGDGIPDVPIPGDGNGDGNQDFPGDGNTPNYTTPATAAGLQGSANQYRQLRQLLGEDAKQWELEFIERMAETNTANNRYDLSNNTFGNAVNSFENSPLATKSRDMAEGLLDDPDNTDWDLVRNKTVDARDDIAEQIVQNISSGAARRGVGAGAVQGMQSQALGQAANDTAAALGDLEIQKARAEQDAKYRALASAGDVNQLYNTSALNARMQQANFQRGAPTTAVSFLEGFGDSWFAQQALDMQAKANDTGSAFSWEDAAGIFGQAGGAFLGTEAGAAALAAFI